MILNQQQNPDCAAYAILAVILKHNPDIDLPKIIEEITTNKASAFTFQMSAKFFRERGYIKGIQACGYSPFLLKKTPIVMRVFNVDWSETGKAPYNLTYRTTKWAAAHYVMCDEHLLGTNSWWPEWGDNGKFHFAQNQIPTFSQIFKVIF